MLEVDDGVWQVLPTDGVACLGGDDFDKKIADWLADGFQQRGCH